jgi:LmbE family N-acetylglucosaminyl deacetylase
VAAATRIDLGNILGIWGHPDDEAWLSAGLMMQTIEAGHRVTCVTATKGEAGFPADDPRSVAERMGVREAELALCLSILGVTDHRWLGYGDGACAQVADEDAVADLTALILERRPDTVLTFGPDGATGHSDHIAVCRWTTRAVEQAGLRDTRLLYATKTHRWVEEFFAGVDPATVMMVDGLEPEVVDESDLDVWFSCDETLLPRKVAAMRAQASQIEQIAETTGPDLFAAMLREEFFRVPSPADAAFIERMTRLTHAGGAAF